MGINLTNLYIDQSFEQLVQISGSALTDGTGSVISNLAITASTALITVSSSYADYATQAGNATNATNATTASLPLQGYVDASIVLSDITLTRGDGTTTLLTITVSGSVENAVSASHALYAEQAGYATSSLNATSSSRSISSATADYATSAGSAVSSSYANNASTADFATSAGSSTTAISASHALYADQAGNALTANTSVSSSYATNASTADYATSAGSSTTAISSSHALNADNSISSSYSVSALSSSYSNTSTSASHANIADTSISSSYALTASYALNVDDPEWDNIINKPAGLVSGSSQIDLSQATGVAANATNAVSASYVSNQENFAKINVNNVFSGTQSFDIITANSASFGHITTVTGSAVIIGESIIVLNNDTPVQRYAGIAVYDSGSASNTSSFQYDGLTDDWFFEKDVLGSTELSVAMFGPEYSVKGVPTYITANTITKGNGDHHLENSIMTDNGSKVTVSGQLEATGFTGSLSGNASTATSASHAVNSDTSISSSYSTSALSSSYASTATSASHAINSDLAISASYATTAGNAGTWDGQYNGAAGITGSLIIGGNFTANLDAVGANVESPVFNFADVVDENGDSFAIAQQLLQYFPGAGPSYDNVFTTQFWDSYGFNYGNEWFVGPRSSGGNLTLNGGSYATMRIRESTTHAGFTEATIAAHTASFSGTGKASVWGADDLLLFSTNTVNGSVTINATDPTGSIALSSETITLNGATTLNSGATINGGATINSGATINGNVLISGSTTISGSTLISGSETVNGDFVANLLPVGANQERPVFNFADVVDENANSFAIAQQLFQYYPGTSPNYDNVFTTQFWDSFGYNYGSEWFVGPRASGGNLLLQSGKVAQFWIRESPSNSGTTESYLSANKVFIVSDTDSQDSFKLYYGNPNGPVETIQLGANPSDNTKTLFNISPEVYTQKRTYGAVGALPGGLDAASSIDCSSANFFSLTLEGTCTLTATNIIAGQTISLLLSKTGTPTLTFDTMFKFADGTAPTIGATGKDILTMISFDGTDLYLVSVQNFA